MLYFCLFLLERTCMQYIMTAMDFTDAEALGRHMANRHAHLAGLKDMTVAETFLNGGATLDAEAVCLVPPLT
jgi:hypothetical protein